MIRFFALTFPVLLLTACASQQPAPVAERNGATGVRTAAVAQPVGPGYYTVKHGDTLYRIAVQHGVTFADLAAWNKLADPSAINDGQVLRVVPPVDAESNATVVSSPIANDSVVETRSLDPVVLAPSVSAAPSGVAATPAKQAIPVTPLAKAGKEPYSDEAYARLNRTGETANPGAPASVPTAPAVVAAPAQSPAPAPVVAADDVPWLWPSPAKVTAPFSEASNKGLDFAGRSGDPVLVAADGKVVYAGSGLRGYGELVIVKHNSTFLSAYAHNRKILVKEGQTVSRGQKIAEMGNTDADSVKLHFEIRKQGKPVDPAQYLPKR